MKQTVYFFIFTVLLFTNSCTDDEHAHDPYMEMSSVTVPIVWESADLSGNGVDESWTVGIPWDGITQDVLDNGAVLVYRLNIGNSWSLLPLTFPWGNYETTVQVWVSVGGVLLSWIDTDLYLPEYPFITQIRIVVIENKSALPENIDLNNFSELEMYFK